MRELRIEEQKSILGGTTWQFTDYTANLDHTSRDFQKLYNIRAGLIAKGHTVSGIESV